MPRFNLQSYPNRILITILFLSLITSCKNPPENSVHLIKEFKKLPANKLTALKIEKDTLFFNINKADKFVQQKLFITNAGRIPLQVSTVVASCNCTKVKYDKKVVMPADSLCIDMTIQVNGSEALSALTIVGNICGGQKTVYLKSL